MKQRWLAAGIAIVAGVTAVAVVLGLSGGTVSGAPTAGEIDVRSLDVGQYPVKPMDINFDVEPGPSDWWRIGALGISEVVATPDQIDPDLVIHGDTGVFSAQFLPSTMSGDVPGGSTDQGPDVLSSIAVRNRMYFGFQAEGFDRRNSLLDLGWPQLQYPGKGLSIMVMQYSNEEAATETEHELFDADFAQYKDRNRFVPVSEYPGAQSHWQPGAPVLRSYLAHGPYVVSVVTATSTADLSEMTALVTKAYDVQLPMLDQRRPVTDIEALHLPMDPNHLLSRTLDPQQEEDSVEAAALGPHGLLHLLPDPPAAKRALDELGVKGGATTNLLGGQGAQASIGPALVLETRDAAAAKKAVAERITFSTDEQDAAPPARIPDAACVQRPGASSTRFLCMVAYRQYVGYSTSDQLIDAQQKATAQYALLANSQWE